MGTGVPVSGNWGTVSENGVQDILMCLRKHENEDSYFIK